MKEARFPEEAAKVQQWLDYTRKDAFAPKREDQNWKEWWCLNELVCSGLSEAVFPNSFYARWLDGDGCADFDLEFDGKKVNLEVTEATTHEDRKSIAALRQTLQLQPIGEPITQSDGRIIDGGRFRGGSNGDDWERGMVEDVTNAIRRKSRKPYAKGAWLLIYPNSNAVFAQPDEVVELLKESEVRIPFERVFVLKGDSGVLVGQGGSKRIQWALMKGRV